ncbi:methylated-DNA--[protein]-cysteine S-methyltransferase [Nocardioides currus]|nr:methylated-DNA--[protein]-cysteine S-methyltransferase [Nocardioides currus]
MLDITVVREADTLVGVFFPDQIGELPADVLGERVDDGFETIVAQLEAYLAGYRLSLDVEMVADGTAFEAAVWQAAVEIPYGETRTWAEVAFDLGDGVTPDQVGAALEACPLSVFIPTHRLLRGTGDLGGYAGGSPRRNVLLVVEERNRPVPPMDLSQVDWDDLNYSPATSPVLSARVSVAGVAA